MQGLAQTLPCSDPLPRPSKSIGAVSMARLVVHDPGEGTHKIGQCFDGNDNRVPMSADIFRNFEEASAIIFFQIEKEGFSISLDLLGEQGWFIWSVSWWILHLNLISLNSLNGWFYTKQRETQPFCCKNCISPLADWHRWVNSDQSLGARYFAPPVICLGEGGDLPVLRA